MSVGVLTPEESGKPGYFGSSGTAFRPFARLDAVRFLHLTRSPWIDTRYRDETVADMCGVISDPRVVDAILKTEASTDER